MSFRWRVQYLKKDEHIFVDYMYMYKNFPLVQGAERKQNVSMINCKSRNIFYSISLRRVSAMNSCKEYNQRHIR